MNSFTKMSAYSWIAFLRKGEPDSRIGNQLSMSTRSHGPGGMLRFRSVLLFVVLFLITGSSLRAQVLAPDLICVRGDTLIWEPATNSCGPFLSYEIFSSNTPTGPFSLLASLTDPGQLFYYDLNPSGEIRYYYLQTSADCPGETQLSSDTLDNLAPNIVPIRSVSVDGNEVIIRWEPSTDPEVVGYIVYRKTLLGDIPIANLGLVDTYTDPNALPNQKSETYFVNAVDACGNTSLFDLPHSTMYLTASTLDCDPNVYLEWPPYENWPEGVETYLIFVSRDGGLTFEEVDGTDNPNFTYTEGNDGEGLCFAVRAGEAGGNAQALSNETCIDLDILQPNRDFALVEADILDDEQTQLNFVWEATDVLDYSLTAFTTDGESTTITNAQELLRTDAELLLSFDAGVSIPWQYLLTTTDACGTEYESTVGGVVLLSGMQSSTGERQLNWNAPVDQGVLEYELVSIDEAGVVTTVGTLPPGQTEFTTTVDLTGEISNCYRVHATVEVETPGGQTIRREWSSNQFCFALPIIAHFPNAFTPGGLNPEFKPLLSNVDDASYSLQIFNRYGQQVFSTTDPDEGWRGRVQGNRSAQVGTYVYRMEIQSPGGETLQREGTVVLIR